MRKAAKTRGLYAGSFDPITRGHLNIIGKALMTFDTVCVAIGTNVRKTRAFAIDESVELIARSIIERWPHALGAPASDRSSRSFFNGRLDVAEFADQSLIRYAQTTGATHIVRGLREPADFNEEFHLHGVAGRIDPSILMTHFFCDAECVHISSSTAKELASMGESVAWLVLPSVEAALEARRSPP